MCRLGLLLKVQLASHNMVSKLRQSEPKPHISDEPGLVSVLVNVWGNDDAAALMRSLESILNQLRQPDEVILVVDGPINKVLSTALQTFVDKANFPVKQISLTSVTGLWNARNTGIRAATYEFIALHDADDVMNPMRLGSQVLEIDGSDIDVLGSPVYEFDPVTERITGLRSMCNTSNFKKKIMWQNVINHSSVMLRKSVVLAIGGYHDVYLAEDYDLWLRMVSAGKNVCITKFVLQAFSVDENLNKRRGGHKFLRSELQIHRIIKTNNSLNFLNLWIRLALRIIYRITPSFVRQIHRNTFQTTKPKKVMSNLSNFLREPAPSVNLIQ